MLTPGRAAGEQEDSAPASKDARRIRLRKCCISNPRWGSSFMQFTRTGLRLVSPLHCAARRAIGCLQRNSASCLVGRCGSAPASRARVERCIQSGKPPAAIGANVGEVACLGKRDSGSGLRASSNQGSRPGPGKIGGRTWIRTREGVSQEIYSLPSLAT
jgi:hypothetical protein